MHGGNNNNDNLSVAVTTALCVIREASCTQLFSFYFQLFTPPWFFLLWLTNTLFSPACTQSQLIYNATVLWPSLVVPFSHNAQHPAENGNTHPSLPFSLEKYLWVHDLMFNMLAQLLCILLSFPSRSDLRRWLISAAIVAASQPAASSAEADILGSSWSAYSFIPTPRTSDWQGATLQCENSVADCTKTCKTCANLKVQLLSWSNIKTPLQ